MTSASAQPMDDGFVPEIIAHRGASRECLENTLAAFERAVAQHADGVELDVHATRDGVVVVHHDAFVRDFRSGQSDRNVVIADTTFGELSTLRLLNFEPIPTLDIVLARLRGLATVYVEVKGLGIEQAVADCLSRHSETRTAVHSFDHRIPREIARLRAGTRTGILSASYVIDVSAMIESAMADDLWQQAAMIDESLVAAVNSVGARVVVWTENDVEHGRRLATTGVAALCTDIPGAMREAFVRHSPGV